MSNSTTYVERSRTSIMFLESALIETTEEQVNAFDNPKEGLRKLVECIFYKGSQSHQVELALKILEYIKRHGAIHFEKGTLKGNPKITLDGTKMSYNTYMVITKHLKEAGMIYGKKGGEIRLSKGFCNFMDYASKCWHSFYISK